CIRERKIRRRENAETSARLKAKPPPRNTKQQCSISKGVESEIRKSGAWFSGEIGMGGRGSAEWLGSFAARPPQFCDRLARPKHSCNAPAISCRDGKARNKRSHAEPSIADC